MLLLKMKEQKSKLELIFDTICQDQNLSVEENRQKKTVQGPLYFLELETQDKWTRLLYADKVSTADLYDCEDQKYLNYSILSIYQKGQDSFLQNQDSNIAKKLLKKLVPKKMPIHRRVYKIDLDDFSEVAEFLDTHIENY
jgi:hypothetical protein